MFVKAGVKLYEWVSRGGIGGRHTVFDSFFAPLFHARLLEFLPAYFLDEPDLELVERIFDVIRALTIQSRARVCARWRGYEYKRVGEYKAIGYFPCASRPERRYMYPMGYLSAGYAVRSPRDNTSNH